MSYVAEFLLGGDTAQARQYALTLPPASAGGVLSLEPSVVWINDGEYLGVVTYGSGSCPSGPYGIEVIAEQEIEIRLGPLFPDRDVCSADVKGHVTIVELPQGITETKPLIARFEDGSMTLGPVSN
jgi:hypothetical protein